ncbi:MAG: HD domain-containing protein [Thermoleophilia bacterium]|nr:HD domain-containing protein [Thermoleophilia bacterium]
MTQETPASYRRFCRLAAAGGLAAVLALLALDGMRVDQALGVVLLGAVISAVLGTVADQGRTALSLLHLPALAAAYVCSAPVAPVVGAALAAFDNRRYGRWVAIGNAGILALSGAAAVGAVRGGGALWGGTEPGSGVWFLTAAAGAVAFMAVNHGLVALMVALKYREPVATVWRAWLMSLAGADVVGSAALIASLGLGAALDDTAHRVVAGLVGVMTVGLLLALLAAGRGRDEAVSAQAVAEAAQGRAEDAERRAVAAEAAAVQRADLASTQLHEVATGTILALVALVDLKDRYTARHSAAVGRLCRMLAEELGWTAEERSLAHVAGLVHDIGKVGIPDAVLRKPSRPTDQEWEIIRRHPDWGADALANVGFSCALVEGVRSHHERWDGSGYGGGLAGRHIPMLGRLVAICDAFDAMTARRPFRPAKPFDAAREEIRDGAGRLFDPRMSEAMLDMLSDADPIDWTLPAADFATEWRRACVGIDMTHLYAADAEAPAETAPAVEA